MKYFVTLLTTSPPQLQQNGYTTMVLTGGYKTEELVTMFSGLEGDTVRTKKKTENTLTN